MNPTRAIDHVSRLHSATLTGQGRKKSHNNETFDSHLRMHLAPLFNQTPINRIEPIDVERLMAKPLSRPPETAVSSEQSPPGLRLIVQFDG